MTCMVVLQSHRDSESRLVQRQWSSDESALCQTGWWRWPWRCPDRGRFFRIRLLRVWHGKVPADVPQSLDARCSPRRDSRHRHVSASLVASCRFVAQQTLRDVAFQHSGVTWCQWYLPAGRHSSSGRWNQASGLWLLRFYRADFSALMLLVGRQEGHPACKNWVMGCWRGYLSWARCRLAYGPADATATHCLLLQ